MSGAHFGGFWALGVSVGVSRGRSVAVLVVSGFLEASWRHFGVILGASWAHLGPTWAHVGLMVGSWWGHVGLMSGHVGASYVGTMLEHLGTLGAVLEHLASTYVVKVMNFKKVLEAQYLSHFWWVGASKLELCWGYVGAMLGYVGPCWAS